MPYNHAWGGMLVRESVYPVIAGVLPGTLTFQFAGGDKLSQRAFDGADAEGGA